VPAVSQENVAIVQRQLELWNSGELDEAMRYFDADVIVEAPEGWPDGLVTRGVDAWRQQAQRLRDDWDEARIEIDEIRPAGGNQVLARLRYVTSGAQPGLSFDTPMAVVFLLRDQKIARARFFWEFERALEAAGLRGP
jgi:ketosteroid isomerase-like protein